MKRYKHFILLTALVALVFTTVLFSSCIFGKPGAGERSGMTEEECEQDFRERYHQQILDHFAENEDIFTRIVDTFAAYTADADDLDIYGNIILGNKSGFEDYYWFTAKRPDPDNKDDIVREFLDFVNDKNINVYDLTKEELDRIFIKMDSSMNSSMQRYEEAYLYSLLYDKNRDDTVAFPGINMGMYNRNDRVEATLFYSKSGADKDNPDSINDHWSIFYSVYWSPAL